MLFDQFSAPINSGKKYLIKRKIIVGDQIMSNGSIFNSIQDNEVESFSKIDPFKKLQTLTTNLENSVIQRTNPQQQFSNDGKSIEGGEGAILPKILVVGSNSLFKKSMIETLQTKLSDTFNRSRMLTHHISDPFYVRTQKTIYQKMKANFKDHSKQWVQTCLKRSEKSVLQRSLQKANETIEHINNDARKRRNTTKLQELVRNNIAEKTFIFPAKMRPEIQGLKGKGGKVLPMFQQSYRAEQIYKLDRSLR